MNAIPESSLSVLAILGMALVTYATRVGGVFLLNRLGQGRPTGALDRWLKAIPGCVLVAIVAPSIFAGGVNEALAALAAALVALKTKSLPLAMVVGVGVVWALRQGKPF